MSLAGGTEPQPRSLRLEAGGESGDESHGDDAARSGNSLRCEGCAETAAPFGVGGIADSTDDGSSGSSGGGGSSSSSSSSCPSTPALSRRGVGDHPPCDEQLPALAPHKADRNPADDGKHSFVSGAQGADDPMDSGVWEVVGGADKGGIIVRRGKELASSQEPQRLSTGAVVKRLALQDGRLRYVLLVGTGPKTGWITTKTGGKDLVIRTSKPPEVPQRNAVQTKAVVLAETPEVPAEEVRTRQTVDLPARTQPHGGNEARKTTEVVPPSGDLVATLQYLVHDGRDPFFYMYQRGDGGEQTHGTFEYSEVKIFDGRSEAAELSLDKQGVMLAPHSTSLSSYDFYERPEKVWGQYYREMRELVQHVTGASRVIVFDHNIRNPREAKWRRGVIGYVPYAHNDYTLESAPMRVRDVARPSKDSAPASLSSAGAAFADEPVVWEEEIDQLLQRRYVIVNVWRNISDAPIAADPLAVADGRTVKQEGYIPTDLIYRDRSGQTYSVTHDPAHRWLYFSGMRKDEAILMKCFDSEERPGAVRWSAHCGFVDPRTPPGAPQRESIDARCIAFFDESDTERTSETAAALFPAAFAETRGR